MSRTLGQAQACADALTNGNWQLFDVVRDPRLNHRVDVRSGILEAECGALLKEFFASR